MNDTRQLQDVAAKLDDIAETLDELKSASEDGDCVTASDIKDVEKQVTRAADVIEDVVDPADH